MIHRIALSATALCALAACNNGPSVSEKNAKPSEVAGAVAAAGAGSFIRPGRWESTTKMDMSGVAMPNMANMPPEVAKQMQTAMNRTTTSTSCLTPEQVKKPGPEVFAGADKRCTYDHFTMSGGKIDAKMTCKEGSMSSTMTMTGTYSADHYTAQNTIETSGGPGGHGMTVKATIDSKRVGDCAKS
jgi:hypothetical protein